MKNADISNFKQILIQGGVCKSLDFEEEVEALEPKEKGWVSLIQKYSGEEKYIYFLDAEYSVPLSEIQSEKWWLGEVEGRVDKFLATWSTVVKPELLETNIYRLQNQLIEKNKLIQVLSVNLEKTHETTAKLLNKISVGIIILFLLTIIICYLAFS